MIERSAVLDTVMTHVFEYSDLERTVKVVYGLDISILEGNWIADERIGHYTYHEWTVDGESELFTVGDDEIVAKWIETGEIENLDMSDVPAYDWADKANVGLEHIMHRLFLDGHIPAGNYLMKVDW
jgi:hypothetical protein